VCRLLVFVSKKIMQGDAHASLPKIYLEGLIEFHRHVHQSGIFCR